MKTQIGMSQKSQTLLFLMYCTFMTLHVILFENVKLMIMWKGLLPYDVNSENLRL